MKERIVVVGGYGHVGRIICEELGRNIPVLYTREEVWKEPSVSVRRQREGAPHAIGYGATGHGSEWERIKLVVMCQIRRTMPGSELASGAGPTMWIYRQKPSFEPSVEVEGPRNPGRQPF